MNSQVVVKNVTVSYGSHVVLDDISFDIYKGDYIGLVGANGSGKTSLVKALLGLVSLDKGQVIYAHNDLKKGYLPQIALTNDGLDRKSVV